LGIGILLVEMPRMLHDVVGDIIGVEPDLSLVADEVEVGALMERVERDRPDVVVIWVASGSPPAMCDELLSRFPSLTVVALEERGQRASVYMMRPMRVRLAEISRGNLVSAIRRAAGPLPFPARVYDAGAHVADTAAARVAPIELSRETITEMMKEQRRGGAVS
jgi:chemotaxis response regulator CheB